MILPIVAAVFWLGALICWLIGVTTPRTQLVKVAMVLIFVWMLVIMLTWRVVI